MPDENNKSVPAPYLPFKTLVSSFDPFSQGLPPRIDRTIWRSQSGLLQGLILNAYRFFLLVDDNDKPTKAFHQLIQKKGDERKGEIAALLKSGYPEIAKHDLMTMTPRMLDELMDNYNVSGDTKKKAVTFFLQAAKYAEVPLSNFLTDITRSTASRRRSGSK